MSRANDNITGDGQQPLDSKHDFQVIKQGAKCRFCGVIVHRRCVASLSSSHCEARLQQSANADALPENVTPQPQSSQSTVNSEEQTTQQQQTKLPLRAVHPGLSIKQRVAAVLREGWLTYHTASDYSQKLHFWRSTAKELAIYDSPNDNVGKTMFKILMDSIIAVEENAEKLYSVSSALKQSGDVKTSSPPVEGISGDFPHVFTIRTPSIVIYAGQDPSFFGKTSDWNELNKGIGRAYGLGWMNTIRQLCFSLPVANSPDDVDIRNLYDVDPENPESIIGSGQFGIVYAAKLKSPAVGQVAIKAIDKKHLENLGKLSLNQFIASEIRIMKAINHPGITRLIECINTTEKIYIVMEKADTDMLDFILSKPNSRLSERTTKFLIKQMLVALKYLHTAHKMAHCDLKPENLLLVFNSGGKAGEKAEQKDEFPSLKLSDFGYSRIIGDHSFRASVVGTPAYLPPEIMTRAPLFNKELDSWSAGVVIFVSLSGVFPYNSDDEEAVLQLQKTPITFPNDPWKKLTPEATSIVKALMEVNVRQRASPAKALKHPWFAQDYQAWCDMRALDARLALMSTASRNRGLEWTTVDEEKQWETFRLANGLPQWQQIGCKL